MESVILHSVPESEMPPFRWRTFRDRAHRAWGVLLFSAPEWAVHLYLGRWVIGIERTREED